MLMSIQGLFCALCSCLWLHNFIHLLIKKWCYDECASGLLHWHNWLNNITWPVTYSHVHALKPAVTKSNWTWLFFPSWILAFYTVLLDKNKYVAYFCWVFGSLSYIFVTKPRSFRNDSTEQSSVHILNSHECLGVGWRCRIHTALKIHDCTFVAARDSRPALCRW